MPKNDSKKRIADLRDAFEEHQRTIQELYIRIEDLQAAIANKMQSDIQEKRQASN